MAHQVSEEYLYGETTNLKYMRYFYEMNSPKKGDILSAQSIPFLPIRDKSLPVIFTVTGKISTGL